jgi:transposase
MTKRKHKGQRATAVEQGLRRARTMAVPYPMELRLRVVRGVEAGAPPQRLAKALGISRETVYAWLKAYRSRGVEGLVPEPGGPKKRQDTVGQKAKRKAVKALREEHPEYGTRRIQAVLSRFEGLGVSETASDMFRFRASSGRQKRRSQKATTPAEPKKEEPDGAVRLLEGANAMRKLGARARLSAAVAGVSPATLRRWRERTRSGRPPRLRRGARRFIPPDPVVAAHVGAMVRRLRGLIGADALRASVPGISRRQALAIKQRTLTQMERERIAGAGRVRVTVPGVIRGFDAMHVETTAGPQYLLVAADSAVPFRTSSRRSEHYDGPAVAETLERDFSEHGAPLVLRLDRARQHATSDVRDVLDRFGVLTLQGPPHHPGFYGQLERQNREHRAWLDLAGLLDPEALDAESELMIERFNHDLPRRTLGFRTAAHAWFSRPRLVLDRPRFRADVDAITARIASTGASKDHAERFAIQAALAEHGLIHIQKGAPALPDIHPR